MRTSTWCGSRYGIDVYEVHGGLVAIDAGDESFAG